MSNYIYKWIEPGEDGKTPVEHRMCEDEILEIYYDWWEAQMIKAGKAHLINPTNCIEDFATVNWAVKEDG